MSIFIGIDLGTSALKCLALKDGVVLATEAVPLQSASPEAGWSEQHPTDWIKAAGQALRALVERIDANAVAGIGLSGQMHGLVLCDRAMNAHRPAMLWNDNRAAAEAKALMRDVPDLSLRAGVPALPGFNAPKMRWLKDSGADLGEVAHTLLPKDVLGHWLHGQVATDPSDAAGTLWFNQAKGAWDADLVAASGCNPDWLPPVQAGHAEIGTLTPKTAAEIGLTAGIPVYAGGGDAATGAVGVGAVEPGRATLSLGTSAQVFLCGDHYKPNPDRYLHAFAHTLPGRFYQMAALLNGARPLAWLGQLLDLKPPDVSALAADADPTRAPIFLPYLTGERSPHGDPTVRAQFHGLDDATTRAGLCYAVLEGIAFSLADAVDSFDGALDGASALALGGGTRSSFLLQMIADVTGLQLLRTEDADNAAAVGAARLAGFGAGALTTAELAEQPQTVEQFSPAASASHTDRLERFRQIYADQKAR